MTRVAGIAPGVSPLSPPKADLRQGAGSTGKLSARELADPQTREAAEGMETMFLDYMFKVMRETVPKDELGLDNAATGIYQGMLDSEVAQKAARANGVGLADQIVAYLEARGYNGRQGRTNDGASMNSVSRTGGTNAGQSKQSVQHSINKSIDTN